MSLQDKAKLTGEKISEKISETVDNIKHAYNRGVIDAKEKKIEIDREANHQSEKTKILLQKKQEEIDRKADEVRHDINDAKLNVKESVEDTKHKMGL